MTDSLRASTAGLALVDKARQRRGWTKTSTACWWQDAHTSKATLRRFWQKERIQRQIFIALCAAVGIEDWQAIVDWTDTQPSEFLEQEEKETTALLELDWLEAPDIEQFYGRQAELAQLEQWVVNDRGKLVAIGGMAGVGKTALALALADRIQSNFESVIWKSLYTAPSLLSLLDNLLYTFKHPCPDTLQTRMAQLLHCLQQHRCLLILDGLDTISRSKKDISEYDQFIQKLGSSRHQSCILITSREPIETINLNAQRTYSLTLKGLLIQDAVALCQAQGFTGKELGLAAFIRLYRGHPLALKLAIPMIQTVFGNNLAAFLSQNTIVIGDRLQAILQKQLDHLTELERDLLYWLAIWQEPVSFSRLQTHLLASADLATVLAALTTLDRRSLLEKWVTTEGTAFGLQPLIMKGVGDRLVCSVVEELKQVIQSQDLAHFKQFRTHALLRPGTDDIAGDRLLNQLREQLLQHYGAALPHTLDQIGLLLQDQPVSVVGYMGWNLSCCFNLMAAKPHAAS